MPARLKKIRKAAAAYGVEIVKPSSGSHWQCRQEGVRMYTVPAHNGARTEIDDIYIKSFCKHFHIDLAEFLARL